MKKTWEKLINRYGFPKVLISIMLVTFFAIALVQNQSLPDLFRNSLVRFGMNGILVLAMVPSIVCGVGLNFGLSLGILSGLLAACISIELNLRGIPAFLVSILISIFLSTIIGYFYGSLLNRVKGDEMTVGTYLGFSLVSLMSIGWLLLPFKSPEMIWAIGGKGLRTTMDLSKRFGKVMDDLIPLKFFGTKLPIGTILLFLFFCFLTWLFLNSKTGISMKAAGSNERFAVASGINVGRQRILGTIVSTVFGGIGIIVYSQSYGFLQLYQAPLMMPFAATAAILIGGATTNNAKISHAISGTFLFQTLLTISLPVINKMMPEGNLSEVIRIIVSNGVILYALTRLGGDE